MKNVFSLAETIVIGAILFGLGLFSTGASAATQKDIIVDAAEEHINVPYLANIVCTELEDMRTLVRGFNAGQRYEMLGRLAAENDFKCWYYQFECVSIYPTFAHERVETIGPRTIYRGTYLRQNVPVYTFSMDPDLLNKKDTPIEEDRKT